MSKKSLQNKLGLTILGVITSLSLISPKPLSANQNNESTFSITPSRPYQGQTKSINLKLNPGETHSDTFTLKNEADFPQTFTLQIREFTPEPDFLILEKPTSNTTLLKLSTEEITLNPKEKQTIPFTISIPSNLKSSNLNLLILAKSNHTSTSNSIQFQTRLGLRLNLNIKNHNFLSANIFNSSLKNSDIFLLTLGSISLIIWFTKKLTKSLKKN